MTPFKTIKPSTLDRDTFISTFADVYEHSPWVADTVYQAGVDETLDYVEVMHERMSQAMLSAHHDTQLALINAHPDLAGKAAVRGELTASSTAEQAGAGIHECTPEEFTRFTELNDAYKAKFGPAWRPKFIAAPTTTPLALALLDVALLTSGGWLGLLGLKK